MSLLTREELKARINSGQEGQIFIDPLLGEDQIGSVSVDLRLGYDFLVSVLNQRPSISLQPDNNHSGPEVFFQSTRRDLGDVFLVHPGQTVLATSLEYMGLPLDVYADIISRSSYHRLGISISSMFQPGFRGCVSLELFNHSNVPIELVVGSRVVQARFFRSEKPEAYMNPGQRRKYIGHVRPTISRASLDTDLPLLASLSKK